MSTYRAYLRTFDGRVPAETKTITADPDAAFSAFAALVRRTDLDGQKLAATLTHDNRQMAFHRFDRPPGDADYWRDKLHTLPIAPDSSTGVHAAADAYLARYRWPDGGAQAMAPEQLRELLRAAFVAGYEWRRDDSR